MKILMLTPYLPYPPSSGGQVRSFNLIKNISKKHDITLFSLIKTEEEKKFIPELEKLCKKVEVFKRPEKPWTLKNILKTGLGLFPFLVVRNWSSSEKEAVFKELAANTYQLIHAETFYVMPHIPETKIPILLVDQTIEFQVYEHVAETFKFWFLRPLLYLDVWKIKYWETKFWKKASKVVAVSEADKEKMQKLVPNLKVGIVPNGVGEDLMNIYMNKKKEMDRPIVFFQGNFSWLQNTEAARTLVIKIFPLIKKVIPNAVCRIVGQGAKAKNSALTGDGVEIVDLENDDIQGVIKAYKEATVFVAPLEGPGGTRLKILGAMSAGVPVVTTPTGIEGIESKNNENVLIRSTDSEIAQAVIELLEKPELFKKITYSARLLVEKKYDWPKISQVLDQIYEEVGNAKQ